MIGRRVMWILIAMFAVGTGLAMTGGPASWQWSVGGLLRALALGVLIGWWLRDLVGPDRA